MSEYNDILKKAATTSDGLNDSDIAALRRAFREHPADAVAAALLLKYADSSLDPEERSAARARVALLSGDAGAIIRFIDPSGQGFDKFYPPLPSENRPTTTGAIDLFLETYGKQSAEETKLLERMIFNPVPDYSEQLARQEGPQRSEPQSAHDALIDSFLRSHPDETAAGKDDEGALSSEPDSEITPPPIHQDEGGEAQVAVPKPRASKSKVQAPTSSLLSESLAKIFIKQGRYERAFEIISQLSLNYPEKSVYFADQLRFLKKLIINQRYAGENKPD